MLHLKGNIQNEWMLPNGVRARRSDKGTPNTKIKLLRYKHIRQELRKWNSQGSIMHLEIVQTNKSTTHSFIWKPQRTHTHTHSHTYFHTWHSHQSVLHLVLGTVVNRSNRFISTHSESLCVCVNLFNNTK